MKIRLTLKHENVWSLVTPRVSDLQIYQVSNRISD